MIHRRDLAGRADGRDVPELVAALVVGGESVRIARLGTLVMGRGPLGCPEAVYQLTLTGAVAKGMGDTEHCTACKVHGVALIDDDVRQLARALRAPVEVHGPARVNAAGEVRTLIIKVQP